MCIPVKKDNETIYHIYLEESFAKLPEYLEMLGVQDKRLCIVSDSTVNARYGDEVAELLNDRCSKVARFVFPAGETLPDMLLLLTCGGLILCRFLLLYLPRRTAALAERPVWILTVIKIWWEHSASLNWCT